MRALAETQRAERAEQSVRESEERFRLLIEGVKDYAIFMLDVDGRIESWNAGAERLKGYRADEIVGQSFERFYLPEDVAAGKPSRLLHIAADAGKVEDEGWRVRKDGTRFWANVLITALRDPTGALRGFGKVTRDMTERREAETRERELVREQTARAAAEAATTQIRQSEDARSEVSERLSVVLGGVTDGISMMDLDGRIVFANTPAAVACGYDTPEQLMAAPLAELSRRFSLYDADDRPVAYDRLPNRRVLAGETETASATLRVRDERTGRTWWSLIQARAVHDAAGRTRAAVSIWRDVSAQHRRERELKLLADTSLALSSTLDAETALRRLADLLVARTADWCAIELLDSDGERAELRPVAVAHRDPQKVEMARHLRTKYPPRRGQPGSFVVMTTRRAALYAEISDEMLVRGAVDPEHLTALRALGFKSAIIVPLTYRDRAFGTLTLVWAESGRRYDDADLALAEELGRRAATTVENTRLYREARDAVQIRDEFVAIAGHELKTPLAALQLQLQGITRLAQRGKLVAGDERLLDRLGKAINVGRRLDELVQELLDVSRITTGRLGLEPQECDLAVVTRLVLERMEDQFATVGSELIFKQDEGVTGRWDRTRLEQVVTNLVANALKYGPGRPIEVTVRGEAHVARLVVRDHGIGIPKEDQDRIFGRFERAVSERHYGGLGLGLWIVRQVIEGHGGTIGIDSEAGEGATFTVELPR